jgi:penicillin-binding protein 1B
LVLRLREQLTDRRVCVVLALGLGAPVLAAAAVAFHLWSTSGELSSYRPQEPSRLFAAPLTLRVGSPVEPVTLIADLHSLGYREVHGAVETGEYSLSSARLRVGLRREEEGEVQGPGVLGGALVEAELADGRVRALSAGGRDLGGSAVVPLGRPLLHSYYDAELRECRPVRLDELPAHVLAAVLAAEDAGFLRHSGVAPVGIVRAAWEDLRAREVRQGGSTITQQLVKNLWLGSQRTLGRKLREAVLAVLVEARYGKRRILEAYLNEVYWGSAGGANLHGIGAASLAYFGKPPAELTLAEAATLAGMLPSPATLSPLTSPDAAQQRRDWVLERMAARRFLPRRIAAAARLEPLVTHPLPLAGRRAPWFAVAMAAEARERFGVERLGGHGYRLLSTLLSTDQGLAERELAGGLADLERVLRREPGHQRHGRPGGPLEGALVSIEPETGGIRAWVGGRDWRRSEFDRVAQARRQAGSAFKPIVYATALSDGRLVPWELLRDSPILVQLGDRTWKPRNGDGWYRGEVTPAEALEMSLNVPAVRVAVRAGLPRVVEVAHAMGVASPLEAVPALALGACEVTPLDLARAYATLASGGRRPGVWGLEAVVEADGEPLVGTAPPASQRVIAADSAYLVGSMLRGVLDRGTGMAARSYGVRGALAGKTGTTDDRRDSWFAGFSEDRATVVWVGYDDNRPTGLSGSRGALPLWSRFVARAEPAGGWAPVVAPAGFVSVEIDPATGLLATPMCPRRVRLELPAWRTPLRECDLHLPPQLAFWEPGLGEGPSESLSELLARSAPLRLHDDVTRLFGRGSDIRVERGPSSPGAPGSSPAPRPPAQ